MNNKQINIHVYQGTGDDEYTRPPVLLVKGARDDEYTRCPVLLLQGAGDE